MWILCAQTVSAMESSVSRGLGISSSDLAVVDITNALGNSGLKRKERDDNSIGSSGSDNGTDINVDERRKEELDKIFKGWGNKDALEAMEAFLSSSDEDLSNGCGIKRLIKDLLVGLLDSNDAETLKSTFENKQSELGKKIDSLKLGDKVIKSRTENDEHKIGEKDGNKETWQSNFGEGLKKETEGVAFANYAPTNDSDLQDGKHCRIPRTNSCMQKFSKSLLNSLIKELDRLDSQEKAKQAPSPAEGEDGGKSPDEDADEDVTMDIKDGASASAKLYYFPDEKKEGHPGVRFIDACCVVLGKKDYHAEIKAFCETSGLTKHEFYAVALITIGYHAKYHFLINGGKRLPFLPTTANGRDNVLDYDNIEFDEEEGGAYTYKSTYIKLFQCVPHGECWGNKEYLLQYSAKAMVDIGRSFVGFYSCFKGYEGLVKLAKYEDGTSAQLSMEYKFKIIGSQIAFRYSGLAFMTPEEREALVKARLFFYRSGVLASALFGKGGKQTRKNLDEGSEMGKLYKEMLDFFDGDEKTFEAKLREKYDLLLLGGELGARWVTLSSHMFGGDKPLTRKDLSGYMLDLYKQLLSEHIQDRFGNEDDFVKRLERRYKRLVDAGKKGGEKAGRWCTLASFMFGDNKHLTRDDLKDNNFMKNLYVQLLKDYDGDEDKFVEKLEKRYNSLVEAGEKAGQLAKLASAFAGTSPPYTQSELSTDMKSLYASFLSEFIDDEENADELDFKRYLKRKYASMVKCGSWGTLASALFGGDGVDKTRDDLVDGSELANLYDELLRNNGGDDADLMIRLREKYDSLVKGGKAGAEWVSSIVKQRECFPHIDDFGEFLEAVLTLEEDGTLSSTDKKMFTRFGNTLKSSNALSKYLDSEGSLPQSNCQELYQSLETILAEGFDLSTNQRGIGSFVDHRWIQFLERHKKVPGIKNLSEFRTGQQVGTYVASHGLALVDNAPMQTKKTKKKVVW